MNIKSFLIEAIVVGISLVVIGLICFCIGNNISILKNKNIYMKLSIYLFVIGLLTHVLYEVIGANKWYCSNGYACKTQYKLI